MNKAIVVVDDDALVRGSLKACFEGAGYIVVAGESVEMAAAKLSMRQFVSCAQLTAVVADFHLDRGITGLSVIRCIKKLHGCDFQGVLITGDHSPDIGSKAKAAGVELLRKPFHFDDLLAVVERWGPPRTEEKNCFRARF